MSVRLSSGLAASVRPSASELSGLRASVRLSAFETLPTDVCLECGLPRYSDTVDGDKA